LNIIFSLFDTIVDLNDDEDNNTEEVIENIAIFTEVQINEDIEYESDIDHLDAGDKVSVHGAMVSERGAGQPSSLEIKGVNLGFTKDFEFTTYEEKNASDFLPSKYEIIECNASSQTISIRDDTLNFTTSYYINANGHNYMHLPRRWWYKEETTSTFLADLQWYYADDLDAGLTYFNPFKDTFWFYDDYYQIIPTETDHNASVKNFKPKNNNERYTILMRDTTYYSESSASGNLNASFARDPENHIYRTFKQLKSINVPAGFNSPEYVATEITRQLQNIKEVKRYELRDPINDLINNASVPGFPIRMYDTIETETYKPFNVAYAYRGDTNTDRTKSNFAGVKEDFNFYIDGGNDSSDNASGYEYLSQYHVVATKRPELYETGRLVNRYSIGGDSYRGIFGTPQGTPTGPGYSDPRKFEISQDYTETNCRRWYEFFKAQELYPEIWNTFNDPRSEYTAGDTIDNSRWLGWQGKALVNEKTKQGYFARNSSYKRIFIKSKQNILGNFVNVKISKLNKNYLLANIIKNKKDRNK